MRVYATLNMDNWNEIRTAAQVARLGTISAAADALGVHRATVTRHIDDLEAQLGAKLFQRHARGFTPTELGLELLRIANATDEQFGQLTRLAKGQSESLSGEITITTVEDIAPHILPRIAAFSSLHPDISVQLSTTDSVMKLEYGEAHVAFRVGSKPDDPDNVVRHYETIDLALYASKSYVERFGRPTSEKQLNGHRFIGRCGGASRAPFNIWLRETVDDEQFKFRANQNHVMRVALASGIGMYFAPVEAARDDPNLIEILPLREEWAVPIWIVTHVDLHRSAKVQTFLEHFKDSSAPGLSYLRSSNMD